MLPYLQMMDSSYSLLSLTPADLFWWLVWQSIPLLVYFYRPQTKFAKVMLLHLSVSHSVHRGVSASVHAGIHTSTPQEQTPPQKQKPPQKQTPPRSRHPPEQTPPRADTPCTVHAGRYGQQAGGTHPTGMHTSLSGRGT